MEDYDLWIRIIKQNKRFYNCPQITVKHRVHNLSAFNSGGKSHGLKRCYRNNYTRILFHSGGHKSFVLFLAISPNHTDG